MAIIGLKIKLNSHKQTKQNKNKNQTNIWIIVTSIMFFHTRHENHEIYKINTRENF